MAYYQLRPDTLRIPMALYVKNRHRLVEALRASGKCPKNALVFLQGGEDTNRHDTDHENLFRQESYFHWAFGVEEAGCFAAICVTSGKSILFIPHLAPDYAVWMGKIASREDFKKRYDVDEVQYVEDIPVTLQSHDVSGAMEVLILHGKNTDSGNFSDEVKFKGIEHFKLNKDVLHPIISNLRVYKTPEEIEVLRYVAGVSSKAHIEVMKSVKAGMSEYQLESLFLHYCYFHGGCRNMSYTCICASGGNSAILHYGHAGAPNSHVIKETDMWYAAITAALDGS